jgi:hypothetical protein
MPGAAGPGGESPVSEHPEEEEQAGRVDLVSILYIVGGIPAIVSFIVVIFLLASWVDIPA